MMEKKLFISTYMKADKIKMDGTAPIYIRLSLNGKRKTYATGHYIKPERWKVTKQLKITRDADEMQTKLRLDELKDKIFKIHSTEADAGRIPTIERLIDLYENPALSQKASHGLNELFQVHNDKFWSKVEIGKRSIESFKKFKTVQDHVMRFLKEKYFVDDYDISKLNLDNLENFESYLRKKKICNNTTLKYCQFFSSTLNTAVRKGWIPANPFKEFEYDFEKVETHYLTEDELQRIESKNFSSPRLQIVKDIFLFSCYTSYGPADISKLTHDHIKTHIDGQKWIFTNRCKTGVESNVPILPPVKKLIEKYREHPECLIWNKLLPCRSNVKMNEYLKEIGDICGIPFNLHFYVGRHTFGTGMITKGVSMESVSKMMGHTSLRMTQHYAKIVANKVGREMKQVSLMYIDNPIGIRRTSTQSE